MRYRFNPNPKNYMRIPVGFTAGKVYDTQYASTPDGSHHKDSAWVWVCDDAGDRRCECVDTHWQKETLGAKGAKRK